MARFGRNKLSAYICALTSGWRMVIHDPPGEPMGPLRSANDSTSNYFSTGRARGIGETFFWSGSGTFTNIFGQTGVVDNKFFLNGALVDSHHAQFAVDDVAPKGLTCTICVDKGPCTANSTQVTGPFFWLNIPSPAPQPSSAEFDDQGTFLAVPTRAE
jgi:hypothetical protein